MNDKDITPSDNETGTVAENQGYADETAAMKSTASARRKADADVKRQNLIATFGSGPGKLALLAVAVIVVVFLALGIGNFRNPPIAQNNAQVDAPRTPENRVTTNPVTPQEAARRAEQSRLEARAAKEEGGSYQPGFDYNIGKANGYQQSEKPAVFTGFDEVNEQTNQTPDSYANPGSMQLKPAQQTSQNQQAEIQRREQEMQRHSDRLAAEQKAAENARDKYVDSVSQEVVKQIGGMLASQGSESLNSLGSYSQTNYYPANAKNSSAATTASATNGAAAGQGATRSKPIIKAGSTAYATLDSEANTDDGRTVLATVRNGKWKGAKLIGQIEQAYNNVSLTFNVMAPQDDRPTMRVRAVALREQDAKMGMAEEINHHTLSRYSALAAAALLQGAGRVYQQPIGTTVVTNGGIVTTTEEPTNRQIIGSAVGEIGIAFGSEIRTRGFNQPSTYSTPAETGFILYFLEDVMLQTGSDQQQQKQPNTQVNPVNIPNSTFPTSPFPQGSNTSAPNYYNSGYGYRPPSGYNPNSYGNNPYPSNFNNGYPNR